MIIQKLCTRESNKVGYSASYKILCYEDFGFWTRSYELILLLPLALAGITLLDPDSDSVGPPTIRSTTVPLKNECNCIVVDKDDLINRVEGLIRIYTD